MKATTTALVLLAATLFAVGAARLTGFALRFGEESVQADFAAFYTAGEAVRAGLSPYRTHADRSPPIWDGVDEFQHSRFLYPPLVAWLFAPLEPLGYHTAKQLWMLLNAASVVVGVLAAASAVGLRWRWTSALLVAAAVALFHPMLPLLERGQIDGVTFALVSLAGRDLVRGRRDGLRPGLLLALATLLKLHVAFAAPFLLLRRRWRAVGGYALGAAGLALLSLAASGPEGLRDYLVVELPRIVRHGERGTAEMRLDAETLGRLRQGMAPGETVKGGRVYKADPLGFVANASLSRVIAVRLAKRGAAVEPGAIALVLFAGLGLLVATVAFWRWPGPAAATASEETALWLAALSVVLLSAPMTWAMSTVWLLALLPLGVALAEPAAGARVGVALWLGGCGLALAAIPDQHAFALVAPFGPRLLDFKYVAGELLVLLGLLLIGPGRPPPASNRDDVEGEVQGGHAVSQPA
jgi:hypothetical protein